jgi:hypothetical protein
MHSGDPSPSVNAGERGSERNSRKNAEYQYKLIRLHTV